MNYIYWHVCVWWCHWIRLVICVRWGMGWDRIHTRPRTSYTWCLPMSRSKCSTMWTCQLRWTSQRREASGQPSCRSYNTMKSRSPMPHSTPTNIVTSTPSIARCDQLTLYKMHPCIYLLANKQVHPRLITLLSDTYMWWMMNMTWPLVWFTF